MWHIRHSFTSRCHSKWLWNCIVHVIFILLIPVIFVNFNALNMHCLGCSPYLRLFTGSGTLTKFSASTNNKNYFHFHLCVWPISIACFNLTFCLSYFYTGEKMSSISIGQSSFQNFFPFHSCVALCFIGPKYTQYTPLDKYQTLYQLLFIICFTY